LKYIRHGTVNFLALLNVHNGHMRSCCLDKNDSEHLCRALPKFAAPIPTISARSLDLDGGPSHVSATTAAFLRSEGTRLRVLFTPPHASWLNQAELLLKSFDVRYLHRGDWPSRQHLIGPSRCQHAGIQSPVGASDQLDLDAPQLARLGRKEVCRTMLNYFPNTPLA